MAEFDSLTNQRDNDDKMMHSNQASGQQRKLEKLHQETLKHNLLDLFVEALEYKEQSLLYILENKHDFILKAIERTKKNEQELRDDLDFKEFDEQYHTKKYTLNEIGNDENDAKDYNYLYDAFFSIYSKIEREENKKNKLRKEETERKLHKIITNIVESDLTRANEELKTPKKILINSYKYKEMKESITNDILKMFSEYSAEDIIKMYDKVLKELLNKYKYTSEPEPEQLKPVKLHWVWKANAVVEAINQFFKHF